MDKIGHLIHVITESLLCNALCNAFICFWCISKMQKGMPFDEHLYWDTYILTVYAHFLRCPVINFSITFCSTASLSAKALGTINLCRPLSLVTSPSRRRKQPSALLKVLATRRIFFSHHPIELPAMQLCCSSPLSNNAHMSYRTTCMNIFLPLSTAQVVLHMRSRYVLRRNSNATGVIIIIKVWATGQQVTIEFHLF